MDVVAGLPTGVDCNPLALWTFANGEAGVAFEVGDVYYNDVLKVQRLNNSPESITEPAPVARSAGLIESIFPSPSNDRATVRFRIERAGTAKIELFDLNGRRIGEQYSAYLQPGLHSTSLGLEGIPSGVYLVVLSTAGNHAERRLVEIK